MAIFQSIVLGSSKGSVGNVTTTKLKGQNVAKAKITSTTNVKSPGQVESRGKMSNIVMAYQFLALFLVYATAWRKSTESVYNAFVRGFKTEISDVVAASAPLAAGLLAGLSGLAGNFVNVSALNLVTSNLTVTFETGGLPYVDGYSIVAITWDETTGEKQQAQRALTSVEWAAGSAVVAGMLEAAGHKGAYIYDSATKKCSNALFA